MTCRRCLPLDGFGRFPSERGASQLAIEYRITCWAIGRLTELPPWNPAGPTQSLTQVTLPTQATLTSSVVTNVRIELAIPSLNIKRRANGLIPLLLLRRHSIHLGTLRETRCVPSPSRTLTSRSFGSSQRLSQ